MEPSTVTAIAASTTTGGIWAILYQILEDVQEGTHPAPSAYQDIEPELPILSWPS